MTAASHKDLVNAVLIALSERGALCWENQTGQGWVGVFVKRIAATVVLSKSRPIAFGLPGSADILACIAGRFVAIECKTGSGRLQKNQQDFRAAVTRAGGIFIEARSVDDVLRTLESLQLLRDAA